jgi:hypothetical protein
MDRKRLRRLAVIEFAAVVGRKKCEGTASQFNGRTTMRKVIVYTALALAAGTTAAEAKGCIKGAFIGGVAGHATGHAVLGAAAGCVTGRHAANNKRAQQDQQKQPDQQKY